MQNTEQQVRPAQPAQAPAAPKAEPPKRPRPAPPPEFQSAAMKGLSAAELVEILRKPSATAFQKAKACQKLASAGAADAVPALAALLTDPRLSHYARYGLEPNPDPSATAALLAALPKTRGLLRAGVIDSIGHRKDASAVPELAKLLYSPDRDSARAAADALGRISGLAAAKALAAALVRAKPDVRSAVAAACLVCAEGLLEQGSRGEALSLYDTLSRKDMPKPVRLAAMHGIIAAETSLSRPRPAPG